MIYIPQFCQMDKISQISKDKNSNMVARGDEKILVRCSIVGDSMVGKTTTVAAFTEADHKEYSPTIFENYAGALEHDGEQYTVSIFDLSGKHEHEDLRAFTYTDSQAFVVCYSAVDRKSFINVKEFWVPEIRKHVRKKKPILVVATQCNLRDTTDYDMDEPVSRQEGEGLVSEIGASGFMEVSHVSVETSNDIFKEIVINIQKQKRKRSRSTKIFQKMLGRT